MPDQLSSYSDTSIIGRHDEVKLLAEKLNAARAGRLQVALIAGEPGIGKTRLMQNVAEAALQEGITVLRGGASEAEGMPPYLPFLEALGRHIRTASPEELNEQTSSMAAILSMILPELEEKLGGLSASYHLPSDQARLRLYEAVGLFLQAIAAPHALLLILDDLQWADPATLDLLSFLSRNNPAARVLVLGAYRESELEQNHALKGAIAELNRQRVLTIIRVAPLPYNDVCELAMHYLGGSIDPRVGATLHSQSEGNPFFAEELLRGWVETGTLVDNGRHWSWADADAPSNELPFTITGAVQQRLSHLSPPVRELLRVASILGRTFDQSFLAQVAGGDIEQVEELLLEASQAHLVRSLGEGFFKFNHDTVRSCLYSEVTSARRARLHGIAGASLEARLDNRSAQHLASLAFHFARSGDRARGVHYAHRAAEQAARTYATDEAITHYRTALTLLSSEDALRGELLLGMGGAALMANSERDAIAALRAAHQWFFKSGDNLAAARALHSLGKARWRLEELPQAHEALMEARALLEDYESPELVRVLVDLGTLLATSLGRPGEGLKYGYQALELARSLGDIQLEAAAGRTLGNLLVRGNNLEAGVPLLEKALDLAVRADDPAEAAECCAFLANAYMWLGRLQESGEITLLRRGFAERCNDIFQLRHVYTWLASTYSCRGQWAEADALLAQATPIVARLASPEPEAFLGIAHAHTHWLRQEYAQAEKYLERSISVLRKLGTSTFGWYMGYPGLIQTALGNREGAYACIEEGERMLPQIPQNSLLAFELISPLAEIVTVFGDAVRAERYYSLLLPFRGLLSYRPADLLLGMLALHLRDWQRAEEHLTAAEEFTRRERMLPDLAATLLLQADLEAARDIRGSQARRRLLLGEALALYEELGTTGAAERVKAQLDATTHQAAPSGLSAREVEVLRFVAEGKSNRQISEALYLSEKTVANHLTNIFTKTGTDNRAAAAAFAIRNGIA